MIMFQLIKTYACIIEAQFLLGVFLGRSVFLLPIEISESCTDACIDVVI